VLVEAATDAGHHVLEVGVSGELCQNCAHAIVTPVSVEHSGGSAVEAAEYTARLAQEILELLEFLLVERGPLPGHGGAGELVQVVGDDAVVGQEAAVVVAQS
jgi:hypothetical protein